MSYETQAELEADIDFQKRNRSVCIQQAQYFRTLPDQGPDSLALCDAILRDEPGPTSTFCRLAAGGPGIADKVEVSNGIDQSKVLDADLLALTQSNWPTVTSLYFAEDGTPLE
jgi:hypothetical protein